MSNGVQLPEYAQCQPLEGCRGPVNALLFSADGKLLISGGECGVHPLTYFIDQKVRR